MKFAMINLIVAMALVAVPQPSWTQELIYRWEKERFPNPRVDPAPFCNSPREPGFVCDPEKHFSLSQSEALNKEIDEIGKLSKCPCSDGCSRGEGSFRIGVAIMKYFNETSYNDENLQEKLNQFAEYLRKSWKLGSCDNDIVIVIASGYPLSALSVGPKASNILQREAFVDLFALYQPSIVEMQFYKSASGIVSLYKKALIKKIYKDNINGDGTGQLLYKSDFNWEYYISMFLIFLFFCVLAVFCIFLALTCIRRKQEADDSDKETGTYDVEGNTNSGFRSLRGLLSRDLWMKADRHSTIDIKKQVPPEAAGSSKNVNVSETKYAELPTGDTQSKLHQTNLDELADIPEMEAYYEEEEDEPAAEVGHGKHHLNFKHATKV